VINEATATAGRFNEQPIANNAQKDTLNQVQLAKMPLHDLSEYPGCRKWE
jgi:hypothetical protein